MNSIKIGGPEGGEKGALELGRLTFGSSLPWQNDLGQVTFFF